MDAFQYGQKKGMQLMNNAICRQFILIRYIKSHFNSVKMFDF
jgi:hypothetical protein